jgi:hypothetical protein
MRLTTLHLDDLRKVRDRQVWLTSAGFEFTGDGVPLSQMSPLRNARLDELWVGDFIDADIRGVNEPAVLELTGKGEKALADAEKAA